MMSILSQPDPGISEMSTGPLLLISMVIGTLIMLAISNRFGGPRVK